MATDAEAEQTEYERRECQAAEFWSDYVYSAWERGEKRPDVPEAMNDALSEILKKMRAAVSKALETGCTLFRYRNSYERQDLTTLIFSDGKGKQFQRTLRIDDRFTIYGQTLHFHDYWWLRVALTSIIVSENAIKRDPRGGWIPDEILDNADQLKADFEADRKGMLRPKLSVDAEVKREKPQT